jgi:endonuclease-3 related protein
VKEKMFPPIQKIIKLLLEAHPADTWWHADSPWEIAVGAVLTQNTNWQNVKSAIANLKSHKLLDIHSIAKKNITSAIRPSGFYNQKTRYLKALANFILREAEGEIELFLQGDLQKTREDLLGLLGVGEETADTILLYAGNQSIFVIDAYTQRLYRRLGYPPPYKYATLQQFFHANLNKDAHLFQTLHGAIVDHCKKFCKKTNPHCNICPLNALCQYAQNLPRFES